MAFDEKFEQHKHDQDTAEKDKAKNFGDFVIRYFEENPDAADALLRRSATRGVAKTRRLNERSGPTGAEGKLVKIASFFFEAIKTKPGAAAIATMFFAFLLAGLLIAGVIEPSDIVNGLEKGSPLSFEQNVTVEGAGN